MIQDLVPTILEYTENHAELLRHNRKLFCVYEGQLMPLVKESLSQHLSPQVFEQMVSRISPINVLIKIVDKLSKIYQQDPSRVVLDGNDTDTELLRYYERSFRMNNTMNVSNECFNLYKNNLLQVYASKGMPQLRSIPSDRFLVYSNDPVDPLNPTHVVLIYGSEKDKYGQDNVIYHLYSDEEFIIYDSKGDIRRDKMAQYGNEEGINEIGKMPFVYINRSKSLLVPLADTDTLRMTVLIPVLLSDLNLAAMYQSFSVMYGINVDDENLVMAPNAFWMFKSDGTTDGTPQIGSIKPETDIDSVLKLIQSQLGFWLQSKGIRAGAVGDLTTENMASGISKMVEESDTTDDRKKQVGYYDPAEDQLWELITKYMHPYFINSGQVDPMPLFSPNARIETNFAQQTPMTNRKNAIEEIVAEMDAGLISKKEAIRRLDPHLTDEEIEQRLDEASDERNFMIGDQNEDRQNQTANESEQT
jgi:hypothetical protein